MSYSPTSPLPRAPQWADQAACADRRYVPIRDFWFAEDSTRDQVRTATTICGHCPVRDACLNAAVREEKGKGEQHRYGIRGGLTAKQRFNRYRQTRRKLATT